MPTPRQKWSTTIGDHRVPHKSEKAAYEYVQQVHATLAGDAAANLTVSIWVDEGRGRGWELYERLRLSDLSPC